MFDNIGTALVQAIGFFGVFAFFVYQLLSDDKKTTNTKLNALTKKGNESKNLNNNPKKKGLFGRKTEPIKEEVKPPKKGLFGRQKEMAKIIEKPKKKGWFN